MKKYLSRALMLSFVAVTAPLCATEDTSRPSCSRSRDALLALYTAAVATRFTSPDARLLETLVGSQRSNNRSAQQSHPAQQNNMHLKPAQQVRRSRKLHQRGNNFNWIPTPKK